jgi:hypothetical protein
LKDLLRTRFIHERREKARKPAIAANRTRSISEGQNTSRHLYELMMRYLNDNLAPGPR